MLHILVNRDGRHLGPYTYDQACQLLAEGKLHTWDLAWPDGSREWVTLDQIDGLSDRALPCANNAEPMRPPPLRQLSKAAQPAQPRSSWCPVTILNSPNATGYGSAFGPACSGSFASHSLSG